MPSAVRRTSETKFNEFHPKVSPDGRWLAYTSDESGETEVYVRRFDAATAGVGRRWQISLNGGSHPKWRRNGKELFFLAADRKLTAVCVHPGTDFSAGSPQPLFQTRLPLTVFLKGYDVAPDGERFLLNRPLDDSTGGAVTVVVGWNPSLSAPGR